MPSEKGIAVTRGQMGRPRLSAEEKERRRLEREARRDQALARLAPEEDDLYRLYSEGNARLDDDALEKLCGITPAMVYAMREIAEGRVTPGAMATIEAFAKFAEIGHRPAKGKARNVDPDAGKSVVFNIMVAEVRPEIAEQQPKPVVIDVMPKQIEPPAAAAVEIKVS